MLKSIKENFKTDFRQFWRQNISKNQSSSREYLWGWWNARRLRKHVVLV